MVLSCLFETKAQNWSDVYFVHDPQTARWSYVETDAAGKAVSKCYYSVESMKGDAVNGSVKLRVEDISASSPTDTLKNHMFYCFRDGEFMVDMKAVFEGEVLESMVTTAIKDQSDFSEEEVKKAIEAVRSQSKISGEIRGIPRYPQVGKLPDYEFQFKFSIMNMKVSGTDRKVLGTECIDTPAGSFDCFVLEETVTTKALMMKEVEKIKSWYAYGVGLVKEITCDKNGKLLSTMVLDSINW
jgi:hypothetical protein